MLHYLNSFQLDDAIDLVIPRGSNKLVSQIKESTKIPVLGHSGKISVISAMNIARHAADFWDLKLRVVILFASVFQMEFVIFMLTKQLMWRWHNVLFWMQRQIILQPVMLWYSSYFILKDQY